MADIEIYKKNNSHIYIKANEGILLELREEFTFFAQNYKFDPRFKAKIWNGKINLLNRSDRTLYYGLLPDLIKSIELSGYSYNVHIENDRNDITPEHIVEFCDGLNVMSGDKKIQHQDYQYYAVYLALKYKRRVILSSTGSGKSLILYSISRWVMQAIEDKILIVVPTINLVKQLYSDFQDYSQANGFDVESNCHMITAGVDKSSTKQIYISTYQSITKQKPEYFHQFGMVIIDECHLAKSNSFVKILGESIYAEYRLGTTGTLDGCEINELVIKGLIGKVSRVSSTSKLIDRGILAQLKIVMYELQYDKALKKSLKFENYKEELDFLVSYKLRNEFIAQLANHLKGNVLILYSYVEKHGKPLYNLLLKRTKKPVHLVHGKISGDIREEIRRIVDSSDDNIIEASFASFATGTNIKNIHHIIFASTVKSSIRLFQSIGRGLRVSDEKKMCTVHDVFDNLVKKSKDNYSLSHASNRMELYSSENFDYEIKRINL